jgi:hypothetical protein
MSASRRVLIGSNRIIPLAVEFVPRDVDRLDLSIGHLHPFRIEVAVELAAFEAGLGSGGADQLHNHLVAHQRLAAPVQGNEGE